MIYSWNDPDGVMLFDKFGNPDSSWYLIYYLTIHFESVFFYYLKTLRGNEEFISFDVIKEESRQLVHSNNSLVFQVTPYYL